MKGWELLAMMLLVAVTVSYIITMTMMLLLMIIKRKWPSFGNKIEQWVQKI